MINGKLWGYHTFANDFKAGDTVYVRSDILTQFAAGSNSSSAPWILATLKSAELVHGKVVKVECCGKESKKTNKAWPKTLTVQATPGKISMDKRHFTIIESVQKEELKREILPSSNYSYRGRYPVHILIIYYELRF